MTYPSPLAPQQPSPTAAYREVSRHATSEGLVLWLRCTACGRPRMLLVPVPTAENPLAAGSHTAGCPVCG